MEEPGACSLISQALNKSTTLGLRTWEITALAAVAGAVSMLQAEQEIALSLEAVKERVRDELDIWVLGPELIDLFEFVVTMGGQTAGFVAELLEFAATVVDSKQRQLRLSAFAMVNKMLAQTPRSKIAVLMRAYRKPPNRTWCPCPESFWARRTRGHSCSLSRCYNIFVARAGPHV